MAKDDTKEKGLKRQLQTELSKMRVQLQAQDTLMQQMAVVVDQLAKGTATHAQQIARVEAFAYSLVKALLLKQVMTYEEYAEVVREYANYQDLLVFWGVRTKEESEALLAELQKKMAEAQAQQPQAQPAG